jgi:hypothetical protein
MLSTDRTGRSSRVRTGRWRADSEMSAKQHDLLPTVTMTPIYLRLRLRNLVDKVVVVLKVSGSCASKLEILEAC